MKPSFKEGDIVRVRTGLHNPRPNTIKKARVLQTWVEGGVRQYLVETIGEGHRGCFDENHTEAA